MVALLLRPLTFCCAESVLVYRPCKRAFPRRTLASALFSRKLSDRFLNNLLSAKTAQENQVSMIAA